MAYSVVYEFRLRDLFTRNARRMARTAQMLKARMRTAGLALLAMERRLKRVGRAMMMRGATITTAMGIPIGAALRGFARMETALLDVRKVFPGTDEQFAGLARGIKQVSTELPLAREEIAKLVEDAARSNVARTAEGLLKYTRVAAEFATAFSLPLDFSSEALAKLKSSLGLSIPELRRLGDTMNWIANNSAASEAAILEVMRRVAALGSAIGGRQGIKGVMALGAAQLAAGVRPDVAATGTRTLLLRLQQMAKPTRDALKRLGLDAHKVARGLTRDMAVTLKLILTRMRAMKAEERGGILADLAGMRAADAFMPLLNNLKLLDDSLRLIEDPLRLGSMNREFKRRTQGMASQARMLANALANLRDSIVEPWAPAIKTLTKRVKRLSQSLAEGHDTIKKFVSGAILGVTGLAVGGAVIGIASWSFGHLLAALRPLGRALMAVGRGIRFFGRAVAAGFLGTSMEALRRYIGRNGMLAALGRMARQIAPRLGWLGIVAGGLMTIWRPLKSFLGSFWEEISSRWQGSELQTIVAQIREGLKSEFSKLIDELTPLADKVAALIPSPIKKGAGWLWKGLSWRSAEDWGFDPRKEAESWGARGKELARRILNPSRGTNYMRRAWDRRGLGRVLRMQYDDIGSASSAVTRSARERIAIETRVRTTLDPIKIDTPASVMLRLPNGGVAGTVPIGAKAPRGRNMAEPAIETPVGP